MDKKKLLNWLEEKEIEFRRKKNKHTGRNNHEWRYGGKIQMIKLLLSEIDKGMFDVEKVSV